MRGFLLVLISITATSFAQAETLMHNGQERSYSVEGRGENTPALLVLHGGGGSGQRIDRYTRFSLAKRGWTIIYPNALDGFWNDGRVGLDGAALRTSDDLGFLKALVTRLTQNGRIDPKRVYAVGASNGGAMTQRLVCQAPELLAGAVVSVMTFPIGLVCPPGPTVPMMFIWGTADPLVPFDGGAIQTRRKHRGAVRSADWTLGFYADRNKCGLANETLLPDVAPDDGVRVRKVSFQDCEAKLEAVVMEGGGHVWPGRAVPRILQNLLGNAVFDISGTHIVEQFVLSLPGR